MALTPGEQERYSRHLLLQEIGAEGQEKLRSSKVLVVGAGGLGCPVLLYLAAAGVGTIGVADYDVVELSNLQRQVIFTVQDIGKSKALCAASFLAERNPFINVVVINEKLTVENTLRVLKNYDIIVDGSDNFATRYMINDACILLGKPLVYGSVYKFNGQVSVFNEQMPSGMRSATYRCVFPVPPASGSVSNCAEAGVLGALTGIIGTVQATEVIKLITGTGKSLAGKLLLLNAREMKFDSVYIERNEALWTEFPTTEEAFIKMDYGYFCNTGSSVKIIDHAEFDRFLKRNVPLQILDVREIHELPLLPELKPLRIPLGQLKKRYEELNPNGKTVVICAEGYRSRLAIKILQEEFGMNNLLNLEGGIRKWLKYRKESING